MKGFSDARVWLAGGVLAALVVLTLSWFVAIGPELGSAHDLRDQAESTRAHNDQLSAEAAALKAKSARLPQYTRSLRTALAALPSDSGLPAFTRQLTAQGTAHGVQVQGVTVGAVTAVTTGAATSTTPSSGSTSKSATPSATPSAGELYSIQVTVQSTGPLKAQQAFLEAVRAAGPRHALITSTSVSPGSGGKVTSVDAGSMVSTQLTVFSTPRSPQQVRQLTKLLRGDLDG